MIAWNLVKGLSGIEILITFGYIYGLIIMWVIFWRLMKKFIFQSELKFFKYSSNKKLLQLSTNDPKNGRLYFKLYLLRITSEKIRKTFFSLPRDMKKGFIIKWGFKHTFKSLLNKYGISIHAFLLKYHYIPEIIYPEIKKIRLRNIEQIYNLTEKEIYSEFQLLLINCIEQDKIETHLLNHASKFVMIAEKTDFNSECYDLLWGDYCSYRRASPQFEFVVRIKIRKNSKPKIVIKKNKIAKISLTEVQKFISISKVQMLDILEELKRHFFGPWHNRSLGDAKKVYIINKYLKVALIDNYSIIFVNNLEFIHCSYLLVDIPKENVEDYDNIQSIDDIAGNLNHMLETQFYEISPETEFWGHSSNLQAWYEHGYDSCLLHSNLSFPLLKGLYEAGDPQAQRVFKEEIAKRFEQDHISVQMSLIKRGYLNYLNNEELIIILQNIDHAKIIKKDWYLAQFLLIELACIGDLTSKKIIRQRILNADLHFFNILLEEGYFNRLTEDELKNLANQLRIPLDNEEDEFIKTILYSIYCMLYKELGEEVLAELFYIELLSSPNINKIVLKRVRDAFPQFKNYRSCEAWRAVKIY